MPIFHLIFQPAVYYSKNALLSAVSLVCLVKNSKVPFYPVTFMGNVQRLGVPFTNGSYTYKLYYLRFTTSSKCAIYGHINTYTARLGDFNSKVISRKKFLQNPFLVCQWSLWEGKIIICTVGSPIEIFFRSFFFHIIITNHTVDLAVAILRLFDIRPCKIYIT